MVRRLLLSGLLALTPGVAWGQSSTGSEVLIRQVGDPGAYDGATLGVLTGLGLLPDAPSDPLSAALWKGLDGTTGDGNTVVVQQSGFFNRAFLSQSGQGNVAAVLQSGTANELDVVQQGSGNVIGAWLVGSRNALSVRQVGDDNRYFLDFAGDDLAHQVIQEGSGLRAIQIGQGGSPFAIRQQGVGTEVRIEHNRVGGRP